MVKYSNVVRFIVREGVQEAFIKLFNERPELDGMNSNILIKTSDKEFCSVGIWEDEASLVKNRDNMIAFLDTLRPMLEEISPELGVTDPVSGTIVAEN